MNKTKSYIGWIVYLVLILLVSSYAVQFRDGGLIQVTTIVLGLFLLGWKAALLDLAVTKEKVEKPIKKKTESDDEYWSKLLTFRQVR